MFHRIRELRQKRAKLAADANALLEASRSESRDLTSEETERFDAFHKEIDTIKAEVDRLERQADVEAELAEQGYRRRSDSRGEDTRPQEELDREERDAFVLFLRGHETAESRAILRAAAERSVPASERRDMGQASGAEGEHFVPQGFVNRINERLQAYGGIRQTRATVLRTASGNPLPHPNDDDVANSAAIVAEGTSSATSTDVTTGSVTIGAYMYRSVVKVSFELIDDSAFPIDGYIEGKLATRLGRGTSAHFTTGNGTTQPEGIVTAADDSTVNISVGSGLTWDELVDIQHAVDPAYRAAGGEWMFHDDMLKIMKKLRVNPGTDDKPLWVPGIAMREPDTVLGDPYVVSNDMPTPTGTNKAIVYGDFSNFVIRDVDTMRLLRLSERFADEGEVGFMLFSRHDSKFVTAADDAVVFADMVA